MPKNLAPLNKTGNTTKPSQSLDGISTTSNQRKPGSILRGLKSQKPNIKIHTVKNSSKKNSASLGGNRQNIKRQIRIKSIHPKKSRSDKSFKVKVISLSFLVLFSFLGGMYFMRSTDKTLATELKQAPENENTLMIGEPAVLGQIAESKDENLLTMTLSQLENYLKARQPSSDPEEIKIQKRKDFLTVYLNTKKSPLGEYADTISRLKHWKIVLAVSNSESSLGRKCAGKSNNCSGIGVKPGHELWREYKDKGEWAKDMDALIEKRYKDWTLEEMNGVYNQPGSDNWVFAANQILQDLQGVE